MALGKEIAKE